MSYKFFNIFFSKTKRYKKFCILDDVKYLTDGIPWIGCVKFRADRPFSYTNFKMDLFYQNDGLDLGRFETKPILSGNRSFKKNGLNNILSFIKNIKKFIVLSRFFPETFVD